VTSPPYVTSYEYADLHQLTVLWLEQVSNLAEFRQRFIGTARPKEKAIIIGSKIGEDTVVALNKRSKGKAKGVATYFSEMRECFQEMYRVLRPGGKACIVIGDTQLLGVKVPNAEVFVEQMMGLGFKLSKVIKRTIPSKILPQTRDPKTGRFTSSSNVNKVLAYPYEFIIVMRKEK
jgi:DNA modification methylase